MILSYSLISSVILACCYLAYKLFLSGERQHEMNRNLILLIYALSLTVPITLLALILHTPHISPTTAANIEIGEITTGMAEAGGNAGILSSVNFLDLVFKIYIAGLIVTLLYYLFGIAMLGRLMMKGERTEFGNFTLILIDGNRKFAPFCWHKSIVMRRKDYEEDGDMILIHEYAHLKLAHWSDLILAYLTICLQWYNPIAWAMREELRDIHEYQADESVIDSGVDTKEYQMLLLKRAVGSRFQTIANSLNHSKLKKRVTMMYEKKTSLRRKMFALALVPALGAGIALTSIPSVAGVLESIATISAESTTFTSAESPSETTAPAKDKTVYVQVEDQADFPGGMQAMMQYIMNNIRYPESAMKNDIQGRVIVKFVVNEDGSVSDAEVLKGVDEELDNEALRVVNSMPKWTPGKVGGKAVASYFTLPVNFRLQNPAPKEETAKEENK